MAHFSLPPFAMSRWHGLLARARAWAQGRERERGADLAAPWIEAYEPRVLYSADLAPHALLFNNTQPVEQRIIDARGDFVAAQTQFQTQRVELLIVDAAVSDRDTLLDQLTTDGRSIEVITLDGATDGVSQISAALAGRNDIAALHILSHGADGELRLGNNTLDAAQLAVRGAEIAQWGNALASAADILLYGCDVAVDARGEAFVQQLSALTGADVAASSNLTGAARLGGGLESGVCVWAC